MAESPATSGPWGPDPALVASAAHVFVDSLDQPVLDETDAHHLGRVLRLRDGEVVSVTDGAGRWRLCTFRRDDTSLFVADDVRTSIGDPPTFAVAVSVPKGDRIDGIVQKLTELGAARIVLLRSDHSIVRWDAGQAARQVVRLQAIAKAASMQSRRLRLPTLDVIGSLDELLRESGVAVATIDGQPIAASAPKVIAVGPEGGWSPRELVIVSSGRHPTVGLGRTVLRTDTAAIAAGVVLASAAG